MQLQFETIKKVSKLNDKSFIKWASEQGIIPDIHQIQICPKCQSLMKVYFSPSYPDGAVYRCCSSKCRNSKSIRLDSWVSQSKLSLRGFVHILACWVEGFDIRTTSKITGVCERSVITRFQTFRSIAEKEYRKDIAQNLLGDGIVEIDESHFFGAKYNKGSALEKEEIWVFGEIDSKTMRVVAEICENRSKEVLIPIICSTVRPNSEIWSDEWKPYNTLSDLGYVHKTVNHSENFVDLITEANTYKIEGTWNLIKGYLIKNGFRDRNYLESYIHEWCFRRNIGNTFEKCWKAIIGEIS